MELDDNTNIVSYEEYHPYGTTAYQAINANINPIAKRYRYTGLERDEENGFGYHNARYYVPWLGRWLSSEPLPMNQSWNLDSYVSNNPICKFDLNGLWEIDMHYFDVYITGRISGATHDQAFKAALGSQFPDDKTGWKDGLNAPSLIFKGLLQHDPLLIRFGNNLHGRGVSNMEAERVAQLGIKTGDEFTFGFGLHPVGDERPHAILGYSSIGHHEGVNESGSASHFYLHDADYTYENPKKALDTTAHFLRLWGEFLHKTNNELNENTKDLLSQYVLADTWNEKVKILRQFGFEGVEEVISVGKWEKEKRAELSEKDWQRNKGFIVPELQKNPNDSARIAPGINLNTLPDSWKKIGGTYPTVQPSKGPNIANPKEVWYPY